MHDNPSLARACASSETLTAVFILDPAFLDPQYEAERSGSGVGRTGSVPLRFLCEALLDVDRMLKKGNQKLVLLVGTPEEVLPAFWKKTKATHLWFEEEEVEPFGKMRDEKIAAKAKADGIVVEGSPSHTLFPMRSYPTAGSTASYASFLNMFHGKGNVPKSLDAPTKFPKPYAVDVEQIGMPASKVWEIVQVDPLKANELNRFPGGESAALARLHERVEKRASWVSTFAKPDTSPCAFDPPSTTGLSPYLTFGCLSARKFWEALNECERESPQKSHPPVSLKGQLLWREFFYLNAFRTPNFDRMEGNPICRQINWFKVEDKTDLDHEPARHLKAWREGKTGYPFIDACMRQLNQEGWMHHLARHAVACFLTRGDLWVSWEHGRDVFSDLLVDGDWSLNNANWMWLSCSAFFHQYYRVYGPVSFPKKYDPHGAFVRKYVPELAKFPDAYIYNPEKAPLDVQRKCGCIVGENYPAPIVGDHAEISKINIAKMQAAFDANKADKEKEKEDQRATKKMKR